MKKNKLSKEELYSTMNMIINSLQLENEILRKKLNNEKLTTLEEVFDKFIVPPSTILKSLKK